MTRERLQSFSLDELKRIARQEGLEPEDGLDRTALLELVLEAFEDSRRDREQENSPSILGEERKYELSQDEELASASEGEEHPVPARYNETRVVAMVRDPHWAFAYWDVEENKARTVRKTPRFESLLLRVRTEENVLFDNANPWFDIPVQPSDSGWYIYLPHPNLLYTLELGYVAGGKYHLLCRSQPIRTPPEAPVEETARHGRRTGLVDEEEMAPDPIERSLRLSLEAAASGSESAIPQRITSLPLEAADE